MQNIVIVSKDKVLTNILERFLDDCYKMTVFSNVTSLIDYIYNLMPDLIMIDIDLDDDKVLAVIHNIKNDPMFSQLPVLGILPDDIPTPDWNVLLIEDYVRRADLERDIISRAALCMVRSKRGVEINPLTRLPGNISINKQIQNSLDSREIFALAYLDLDHFKPFNDKYGFSRGDEIIKVTGRIVLNIVKNRQPQDSFIGHIGGDDFVFIMHVGLVEDVSEEIFHAFDRIVPTFYDTDDLKRNAINSKDRQGNKKTYPIMSASIGIAHNRFISFSHYGEIIEVASRMKSYAKKYKGSCFKICRRRAAV